jgi:hypothetical protein
MEIPFKRLSQSHRSTPLRKGQKTEFLTSNHSCRTRLFSRKTRFLQRTHRSTGRGRHLVRTILMVTLLLTMTLQVASAHGEDRTLQLSNATAGPFRVTVWTAPGILRTGEIHVEAAVIGVDGASLRDVLVQVDVSSLAGNAEALTAMAYPAFETNGVTQEWVSGSLSWRRQKCCTSPITSCYGRGF